MKQIGTQNTVTINTSNIVSISKIIYGDWITGFSFSYAELNLPQPVLCLLCLLNPSTIGIIYVFTSFSSCF